MIDVSANGVDWRQRAEPRKYVWAANIPGMDDGIAACKNRERLRPQQAMSIGNRANGSHQTIEVALASCQGEPQHGARGANCKMPPEFAKRSTELCCRLPRAPRPRAH